jgi:hypothetical protein
VAYTILFRRGTDDQWTQANPLLNLGELGFVTDTKRFKIGDGLTNWNSLPYSVATLVDGKIPLDQIPDTSKITVSSVSSIAQRNSLVVQSGDIAIVAEEEKTYAYNGTAWVELLTSPDLSGIATEQYVDDSIDNLNLSQYQSLQDVNDIVDSAIDDADLEQYATIVYVDQTISDLDLPDSELFQVDYQDQSILYGNDIPHIGNNSASQIYSYVGVTGVGDGIFTSSSAILSQYPSASTVFYSTGVGRGSMSASYLNFENTAVGYGTLIKGGFQNVAIGTNALNSIQPDPNDSRFFPETSKGNTGVGHHSLFAVTTGKDNTALGHNSMINAATGHSNIAIGADSLRHTHDLEAFNGQYAIAIGASATVPGNATIKIGNANQVIISDNPIFRYADERDMSSVSNISFGLDFLNELRPVEFVSDPRNGEQARNSLGFVASEVASASPTFAGYIDFDSEGNSDIKALAYDQFIPPIVKSIQEIDTRLIVTESELSEVAILSASVAALTASVGVLLEGEATYETYTVSTSAGDYFFSASAGNSNPTVTLVKGRKYRFDLSGVAGTDPFALRESDQVENFVLGTTGNDPVNGVSGSSDSNFIFYTVPGVPPYTSIIYQSSINSATGGVINLVDP